MNDEDIREFLDNLPDKLDILEQGVDFQIQKEYIDYSHTFDRGELTETETVKLSSILYDIKMSIEDKKKSLTILAHLGTIIAFRQIEKYYTNPDNALKQWTVLALQECKMFLASALTDQSTGFISSGLGGLNNRLRYYFLILPSSDRPFSTTQKNIIKEELSLVAEDLNSILESIDPSDTFVGLTVLAPMDISVGSLIETGIKKCNELGNFVFEPYYVTNQSIPDESEIKEIIKIIKE